jgi:hypothetical protein
MFSNLDSIDWNRLGYHTYPNHKHDEIPRAIRNLLSPDDKVREEARGFLLGTGQDFGDIYDTTPQIIPFCLEVLAMDGAPGKAELMHHLSGQGMYIAEAGARSVHMMDLCVQTYAALRTGLDLYLDLLAQGDRDERLAVCELLQYMSDDPERLIPMLLAQIHHEEDEAVQVSVLYCLKQLFGSLEWRRFQLKKQYAPELRVIVEDHPSQTVQVAAARASVELVGRFQQREEELLSPQVGELLARKFLQPGPPMHWTEDHPSIYQEHIVRDLARLPDPAPLLGLLASPGITAEQANLLARGLLCHALIDREQHNRHWQQMTSYGKRKKGNFFLCEYDIPLWKLKTDRVRLILQAIAAADRLWELPTNLFSYFYGLPDSRQALRTLAEEMTA